MDNKKNHDTKMGTDNSQFSIDQKKYSKTMKSVHAEDGTIFSPLAGVLPEWDLLPQQNFVRRIRRN